jgi:hypothetical protein
MFYELFLVDVDGELIDVPVLIQNYVDGADSPNKGSVKENYKFVRRFFIYDTLSALSGPGEYVTRAKNATAVRWPHEVKLLVELDENNRE